MRWCEDYVIFEEVVFFVELFVFFCDVIGVVDCLECWDFWFVFFCEL